MKNTVTVYNLTENDIIGARRAKKEDYDLPCMVMIGLGDHENTQPGTTLKMLDVLFSKKLETQKKQVKCDIAETHRFYPYYYWETRVTPCFFVAR